MSAIKAAITYKCHLPSSHQLETHLEDHRFGDDLSLMQFCKSGFINIHGTDRLCMSYPGGLAFTIRYEEKIIPKSIVKAESKKKISKTEKDESRKLSKKEQKVIEEAIYTDLLQKALIKTTEITSYYNPEHRLLVVPTASKKLADIVTSALVKAVGSIRATTIYIDEFSKGLTPKIEDHMNDKYTFDYFEVCGAIKLKTKNKQSFSFNVSDISNAKKGILEAIAAGAYVHQVEFSNNVLHFRLNDKFIIKGLKFICEDDESEFDNEFERIVHETSVQMALFTAAHNDLIKMFEYKEPS